MTDLDSLRKLSELIAALDKNKTPVRAVGVQMVGLEQYILRISGNELETLREAAQALAEQARDAEALRLIKKHGLLITPIFNQRMADTGLSWVVTNYKGDGKGGSVGARGNAENITLNLAIDECVAALSKGSNDA